MDSEETPAPFFWSRAWAWIKKASRTAAAPVAILVIVVVAGILIALGVKKIQIGGIIGKLLGKSPPGGAKTIEVANSIPKDRVDASGKLIPIGQPDSTGITQAQVVEVEEPGLFGDPSRVKVMPPGATEPIEVVLPDGVKAHDVSHVVIVTPEVVAVTVKDNSKVSAKDVDDLLAKYGNGK